MIDAIRHLRISMGVDRWDSILIVSLIIAFTLLACFYKKVGTRLIAWQFKVDVDDDESEEGQ